MKYKVIVDRKAETSNPIDIIKGDRVMPIEESNPEGDWPNWVYCNTGKKCGWIPKQIIDESNIILEDYNAREFNISVGDIIDGEKIINGWIWGIKNGQGAVRGWVPLNCIKECSR